VLKTSLTSDLQQGINTLAVQPDGKVLIAGGFDFVNGTMIGKLQRLNTDGTSDGSFNPGGTGFNGFIAAILLQPDGKILVAGGFTTFNSLTRALLVRLNADGSLDPSFTFAPAPDDFRQLTALALQSDGKILIGSTLSFATQSSGGLVRLNSDGSPDPTFNIGTGIASSTLPVLARAILVQADGKILLGGSFTVFNGQPVGNLVRLNSTGSVDASFNIGSSTNPGADNSVRSLVQQPDGKLLIGGNFTRFDGQPIVNLTRRLLDGSVDPDFQVNTNTTAGMGTIASIRLQANGGILIGGTFTQYNGVARSRVARLDASGALDPNFGAGIGPNMAVNNLALAPTGQVLVGGGFVQYNGQPHSGVVRLNAAGLAEPGFAPVIEARGVINQAVALPNGQLLVSGNATQFNGQLLPGTNTSIRRINTDGTVDANFVSQAPDAGTIQALQPNGSFYVLGNTVTRLLASGAADNTFTAQTFGGETSNSFYLLNGALGLSNGQLLVFGFFRRYGALTGLSGLVRLNADGTPDNTFGPTGLPANNRVSQVSLQPGGKLVVVGNDINNVATTVVRLNANGTIDNTFSVGTAAGPGGNYSVLVQPDGRLLVNGGPGGFNGQPTPFGLTRLTLDGAPDPTFSGLAGNYSAYTVQPDGRLLVLRNLPISLRASTELLRLNSDGSVDTSFNPVAIPQSVFVNDDVIRGVVVQPNAGKIVLYGSFRYVAGQVRIGLARLTSTGLAARSGAALRPLAVYPNPAQEAVTIQLPAAAQPRPASLLDLNGRLVRRWVVPAQQAEVRLSLEQVAIGVYLLQVRGAEAVYQQKVVVTP
jgi:uncharacterized delta-60 repeat protein